jgi:predicted nucleic acid-binding protein
MNGPIERLFVLDSNVVIDFLNNKINALPKSEGSEETQYFVSVITEMEILSYPKSTPEDEADARTFLSGVSIVPLEDTIKREAIAIRRNGNPRPKLPDAIVAATAVALEATLVTQDTGLLNLSWPGFRVLDIF